MALTDAQKRALRRKAANNSLEVEHLVRVAAAGDASDAPFVRALKAGHAWSDTGRDGGARFVSLGRWADVVCRFLEDGYAGLVRMARESAGNAEFCVGLLSEVTRAESVPALLAIGGPAVRRAAADVRLAARVADGFNMLLFSRGGVVIDPKMEQRVRVFLHRLLAADLTEAQRASAVCALRWVGNEESAALIEGRPPFRGCWAGLDRSTVRQIRKRTRAPEGEDPGGRP